MSRPSEIIALLAEGGVLRGVRFAPRGRDAWTRTGGGVWPLEDAEVDVAEGAAETEQGTVVESDTPLARAFSAARNALGVRRVVIALPLSRLLVRVLSFPVEMREDLAEAVTLQMDKLSPFPGEELSVGFEIVSETETSLRVFAAALPEAVFEDLGGALRASGLQVLRTDASILGWFRTVRGPCHLDRPGRRVVLADPDGGWDLLVLDQGVPVLVRGLGALPDDESLVREVMLSLLNAELEAGHGAVAELVILSHQPPTAALRERLEKLTGAPVRFETPPSEDGGVEGVALRTGEGATLDLTPQVWRDAMKEEAVRRRVLTGVVAALVVWVLGMGVLFSGPVVYRQLTARQNQASRAHFKAHKAVADTRERVNLIQAYTDRTYSALEMLKLVSERLPPGITLAGFTYRRDDGVRISGDAVQPTLVYDFKNAVTESPLFETVGLVGPSASKGLHKFDVDAKFKGVTQK